jgi:glycine/D-amino acid oxidase-like deaminating enzyme
MRHLQAGVVSRRWLLVGAASAAGSIQLTFDLAGAHAAPTPAPAMPLLFPGNNLQEPDLDVAPEDYQCVMGLRPHRTGGVRLEMAGPIETGHGKKYLIHNYGHGGAGITLSFGCADIVQEWVAKLTTELKKQKIVPSVAVLGCGVIGLTTASELRRKWPHLKIAVYAPDLDIKKTTSFLAGGQFEPSGIFREYLKEGGPPIATLHDYLRRSYDRIAQIVKAKQGDAYGIAFRRNFTLEDGSEGFDKGTPLDVVPAPKIGKLPFKNLNDEGREYRSWLINPKILLPKLMSDLKKSGTEFHQQTFAGKDDFNNKLQDNTIKENIVINCTGLASRELFGDDNVHAIKGHLVILKNKAKLAYFFSGGCEKNDKDKIAYMFARQEDIVIGGSYITCDSESCHESDDDIKKAGKVLLERMRNVFNGNAHNC